MVDVGSGGWVRVLVRHKEIAPWEGPGLKTRYWSSLFGITPPGFYNELRIMDDVFFGQAAEC